MSEDTRKEGTKAENMEPEVKEFVSRTREKSTLGTAKTKSAGKSSARKNSSIRRQRRKSEEQVIILAGFVLMTILFIVLGTLACKVALTVVCLTALLEVILARCLYPLPIWIHLVILIIEIVAGAFVGQALFAIMAALVYLIAVILLCYRKRG